MNMSYCRFQNTARDFQDCVENIRSLNPDDYSQNTCAERAARAQLIRAAALLLEELGIADPASAREIDAAIFDLDREPLDTEGEEDE